jgi:hypothetical protein
MSFRGELREFELPDILQLIASQQKAGWLKVIWKGRCQFIFFRDGKITSTKNPADEIDPLETFILRRNYLTEDQTDRVSAIRRKTGLDIQDILQKEGILSREEIQETFEAMVESVIFELMSLRSGQYEFETEEGPDAPPDGALVAEIGPILLEGARKADEVNEMRRFLGPEGGVLALTPAGRSAAAAAAPDEAVLLALVNGVRTIDAILEECGLDRYSGTRSLFACARNGWVKPLRASGEGTDAHHVEAVFDPARTARWGLPVAALLAAALLLTLHGARVHAEDPAVGEWRARAASLELSAELQRLGVAVEAHNVRHGRYPASLDDLAAPPERAADFSYLSLGDGTDYFLGLATGANRR